MVYKRTCSLLCSFYSGRRAMLLPTISSDKGHAMLLGLRDDLGNSFNLEGYPQTRPNSEHTN